MPPWLSWKRPRPKRISSSVTTGPMLGGLSGSHGHWKRPDKPSCCRLGIFGPVATSSWKCRKLPLKRNARLLCCRPIILPPNSRNLNGPPHSHTIPRAQRVCCCPFVCATARHPVCYLPSFMLIWWVWMKRPQRKSCWPVSTANAPNQKQRRCFQRPPPRPQPSRRHFPVPCRRCGMCRTIATRISPGALKCWKTLGKIWFPEKPRG